MEGPLEISHIAEGYPSLNILNEMKKSNHFPTHPKTHMEYRTLFKPYFRIDLVKLIPSIWYFLLSLGFNCILIVDPVVENCSLLDNSLQATHFEYIQLL